MDSTIVLSGLAVVLGYSIHYGYLHSILRDDIPIEFDRRIFYVNFALLTFGYLGFLHSTATTSKLQTLAILMLIASTLYMFYQDIRFLDGKRESEYYIDLANPDLATTLQVLSWAILVYTTSRRSTKSMVAFVLMMGILLYFIPQCRVLQFPDHPGYGLLMACWIVIAFTHNNF